MNQQLEQQSLEAKIVSFCLRTECYDRVKNILTKDMFEGEWASMWQALVDAHAEYSSDLTGAELQAYFDSRHPALPDSTRYRYWELFYTLEDNIGKNTDLQERVIRDLWMRHRARIISELSVNIFLGKENNFGELKRLIESTAEDSIGEKTTYTEVDMGLPCGKLSSTPTQNTPQTSQEPSYRLISTRGTPPYLTALDIGTGSFFTHSRITSVKTLIYKRE